MMTEASGRYQRLVNSLPIPFASFGLILDELGRPHNFLILDLNPAFERLLGRDRSRLLGRPLTEAIPEILQSAPGWLGSLAAVALDNSQADFECCLGDPESRIRVHAWPDQAGEVMAIFHDPTALRQDDARLRVAAQVFAASREGIVITDAGGVIQDCNQTFERLTRYPRSELVGCNIDMLGVDVHGRNVFRSIWYSLQRKGFWHGELRNRHRNGMEFDVFLSMGAVESDVHQHRLYVGMFTDLSEQKLHERQLQYLQNHDALTGLLNRHGLCSQVAEAMASSRRNGNQLGLAMIDLDDFAGLNEAHGRETGDRLLRLLGNRLRESMQSGDFCGRLGGDEFAVVFTNRPAAEVFPGLLDKLSQAIRQPFAEIGPGIELKASMGLAIYPHAQQHDDIDADQLLRHADQAMCLAKLRGPDARLIFDPCGDRLARHRLEQLAELQAALDRQEFVLHYQPKVNMRSGEVLGFEALIRWEHPQHGLMYPESFISLVESETLVLKFGDWVLQTALEHLADWNRRGFRTQVSVNVAPSQLMDPAFTGRTLAALEQYPEIEAGQLQLEILETGAIDNLEHVAQQIGILADSGIASALDDFGTGYSSLSFLKRLPSREVKIDRSFVIELLHDPEHAHIIRGIVRLANSLARHVIAEGVETEEHGLRLLELGCEAGQGFGISRPMAPDHVPCWVDQWRPPQSWSAFRPRQHLAGIVCTYGMD